MKNKNLLIKSISLIFIIFFIISIFYFSFFATNVLAEEYTNDVSWEDFEKYKPGEVFEKNGKKYKYDDKNIYELNIYNEEIVESKQEIVKIPSIGMTKSFDSASEPGKKAFLYSLAFAIPKDKAVKRDFTINYLDLIYLKYYSDLIIHDVRELKDTNKIKDTCLRELTEYNVSVAGINEYDINYFDLSLTQEEAQNKFKYMAHQYTPSNVPLFVYSEDINKMVSKAEIEKQLNVKYGEIITLKNYNFEHVSDLQPTSDLEDEFEYKYLKETHNFYEDNKIRKRVNNNKKIKYTNWSEDLNFFEKLFNNELFKNYSDKSIEANNYTKINLSSDIDNILIDKSEKTNLSNFFNTYKFTHDVYVVYFDFYETDYITTEKFFNSPDKDYFSIIYKDSSGKYNHNCNVIKDFKIYQDLETIEMSTSYKDIHNQTVTEVVKTYNKPIVILTPNVPNNPQPDVQLTFKNFFEKIGVYIKYILISIAVLFGLIILTWIINLFKVIITPATKTYKYYKKRRRRNNEK